MKKLVLNAAPNINVTEIVEEMKEIHVEVKDCIPLKGKGKLPYSYLISVTRNTQISEVQKIGFGHSETNYFRKPKYVKSLKSHHTKEFTLTDRR